MLQHFNYSNIHRFVILSLDGKKNVFMLLYNVEFSRAHVDEATNLSFCMVSNEIRHPRYKDVKI